MFAAEALMLAPGLFTWDSSQVVISTDIVKCMGWGNKEECFTQILFADCLKTTTHLNHPLTCGKQ